MSKVPTEIIDLHTHLFNARGVPLAGIIADVLGKNADECAMARYLAKLVTSITANNLRVPQTYGLAFATNEDYADLISATALQLLGADSGLVLQEDVSRQLLVFDVNEGAEDSRADIRDALQGLEASLIEIDVIQAPNMLDAAAFDGGFFANRVKVIIAAAFKHIAGFVDKLDEIQNYGEFVYRMLSSEDSMAHALFRDYGGELPKLRIVHHMMDMQYAYVLGNCPPSAVAPFYPYYANPLDNTTQLGRMKSLSQSHEDKIISFGAFDPRRSDWLVLAKAARESGCRGFKFYPAMGYLPFGVNTEPQRAGPINPKDVSGRVRDFFLFCNDEGIPVFTHCTPQGFQTRFHEGLNTDPDHWRDLLDSPGMDGLRLCYGHAGGGDSTNQRGLHSAGWTARNADEWMAKDNFASKVAKLCRDYENVYCEFAYITELFAGQSQTEARESFLRNLRGELAAPGYDFAKKIAYGSDWHMPSVVGHPREYLSVFLDMFGNEQDLQPICDDFFYKNAERYMGLRLD